MGLDWCLESLIEGKEPLDFVGAERCDPQNPRHKRICDEIICSHRRASQNGNGTDSYKAYWNQDDQKLLEEMQGKVMADTVPFDSRPYCSAWDSPFAMLSGVEAFRGKRIDACSLLPEFIKVQAYEDRYPDQMREYAEMLESFLPDSPPFDYDSLTDKIQNRQEYDQVPDLYYDMQVINDATKWLRYWSRHPVKLVAWY